MLELAIQLTHLTQHYRAYICTISPVKSASRGIWLKARLSTVENRPMHSLKTSLTISPVKRAYRHKLSNCRQTLPWDYFRVARYPAGRVRGREISVAHSKMTAVDTPLTS